jgi:long-chain acyl-CoA synthetase
VERESSIATIAELPFHVLGRYPRTTLVGRCQGDRIVGLSNKEFFERLRDVSLGLSALGMRGGDRVALISESRPEWLIADLAIVTAGAVTVPVYPTVTAAQVGQIVADAGARLAIVSTRTQLDKLQEIRHQLPDLEAVVVMDAATAGASPSVVALDEIAARGHSRLVGEWGAAKDFQDCARAIGPDQLATIIYTSGTTGQPKGVMLTHANLTSNMRASAEVLDVDEEDVALSFLPLSHAFERICSYVYLYCGVTIVFAESFESVARDILLVRPTVVSGVPRVYEKICARVMEKGNEGPSARAALFRWAVNAGVAKARKTLRGRTPGPVVRIQAAIADRLVFRTIRAGVGGRLRYMVSGSAPLAVEIAEFFEGVGLPIVEGYGLTETAPVLTVNPPEAPRVGTVGRPLPGVELRIAPDGEILARGPNVMTGYYNKPEATAAVLSDGWFHTGDIGTLDDEGYLTITDRKKDVLVTSGGKKIAPQPIEAVLKRSSLVAEAVVLGDRRKYAVALIAPDFAALERRLKDLGRPAAPREELVTRADVLALYQEIVDALNRDLSQFERIKRIALVPAEFSISTGELTPTMKVRRKVVEERWRKQIEELYRE